MRPDPPANVASMAAGPTLHTLHVGDDPATWTRAGFEVAPPTDSCRASVRLGDVRVLLHGDDGPRGLLRWDLELTPPAGGSSDAADVPKTVPAMAELPADLDGLPTAWAPAPAVTGGDNSAHQSPHPNGVTEMDHLVISSPDVDRTAAALSTVGFEARRTRETDDYGETMRQVFFWAGSVIVELVGPADQKQSGGARSATDATAGPAAFFGLALTSADLDATAAVLSGAMGSPRPAVQPDRRIATLRFNLLGGSVATVVMSPHSGDG